MATRPPREQFQSRVRLQVAGENELLERYATNLSDRGLFVQDDAPPAVGSLVLVEFVLPEGQSLSRIVGRVVHARAALAPGEKTAGMGLEFVELDEVAQALRKKAKGNPTPEPPPRETPVSGAITVSPRAQHRAPLLALKGPVVGIDLGTSNSGVAAVIDDVPKVLSAPGGFQTIPSIVHITPDDEITVGHLARERMILQPDRAVYGSKRFLGRPFRSTEVRNLGHFFRYQLVEGKDGRAAAQLGDTRLTLEDVAAHVLRRLKTIAENALETDVQRAVITVPAYFGETQRQAVRDAARTAGLHVERILNEPTAAAVAYGFARGLDETVLVYDLGGGTFDVAVLRVQGDRFSVIATDGDPFLGGSDFDDRLTEYVLRNFEKEPGVQLREDAVAVQRIRFAVEMAKKQLSEAPRAHLDLPYINMKGPGPRDLRLTLERAVAEALTADLVERTLALTQGVLDRAHLSGSDLDDVVLVGGQSRSPQVRRALFDRFGRRPRTPVHPDEAVALGAARIADAVQREATLSLTELLPASIRVADATGQARVLLPRGTPLPAERVLPVKPLAAGQVTELVLQRGEHPQADQNTPLGTLKIPAAHAATQVTLTISADGLLSARASDADGAESASLSVLLI